MAVTVRYIRRDPSGTYTLMGDAFIASTSGLNDAQGFQEGMYESRVYEEGKFSLTFPNEAGSDAVQHIDRFMVTSPTTLYYPGNEWIEIYDGSDLMYVGTPVDPQTIDRQRVQLGGSDAFYLLRKHREYYAGYWSHAPRDVWEHYTQAWKIFIAEDFAGGIPDTARFVTSGTITTPNPSNLRMSGASYIRTVNSFPIGVASSAPYSSWQVKVNFTRNRFGDDNTKLGGGNANVRVGVRTTAGTDLIYLRLQEKYTYMHGPNDVPGATDPLNIDCQTQTDPPGPFEVIVEGRDRWVYFFLNQSLLGAIPMPLGSYTVRPFVSIDPADSPVSPYVDVDNITARRTLPFLMRGSQKGDYHLPVGGVNLTGHQAELAGVPSGGLHGRYYNDSQLHNADDTTMGGTLGYYYAHVFGPTRQDVYMERLDKTINFTSGSWWPSGPTNGLWWSARWTGAIFLELGSGDHSVTIETDTEPFRLWIGKTRRGEEVMDHWFTGLGGGTVSSLRGVIPVGADGEWHDGWYPIVLEYANKDNPGASCVLKVDGTVVPVSRLSPFGIFQDQIRSTSHYDAIKSLSSSFGYQMSVEPQTLESGAFPGILAPKNRVGKDTDLILTSADVQDMQTSINADDTAQALIGDGTGLQDDSTEAQLTLEALDFITAEDTLMLLTEEEQFGEIGYAPLLMRRLTNLLALRSSPWEEVSASPPGWRELRDTFPLTSTLSMFNWSAGDAVRLNFPKLGVVDSTPRQILGVQRPFYPVGLRAVSITFKQRPRTLRTFLQEVIKTSKARQRKFQGQMVRNMGTPAAGPSEADAPDFAKISRIPLPVNLAKVSGAQITLFEKPDGDVPWYIYVNGVKTALPAVTEPGIYDISAYVDRVIAGTETRPHMEVEFRLS